MIDDKQIRAARALLQWKLEYLAGLTGLSYQALYNIENGRTTGRVKNMANIQRAFEQAGIEFLPGSGLRKKDNRILEFKGDHCFIDFLHFAHRTLRSSAQEKELLFAYANNAKSPDDVLILQRQMLKDGIEIKWLIEESDNYVIFPLRQYRQIPKKEFLNIVNIIFADHVAFLFIEAQEVVAINHRELYQQKKLEFNSRWVNGKMPLNSVAPIQYNHAGEPNAG